MSSREEISSEKNETEFSTPRERDEEMSSSSSSPQEEESINEDPRRTTPRLYDSDINNNDNSNPNFDRDRTRVQIRDNFNNELRKLKEKLQGGDINEIYSQALENIKSNIPDSDKFNLTFRKDKNGNYNGLIILNRFSKRKTPSVKSLPPPPPEEPMRIMKRRTFSKMPKVVEPDDNDNDNDEQLLLPPSPPIPSRTPRQRSSTRSVNNTDRRGAVRRPKTDQALEATVKTLATEIEKINNRLLKMKMAKNDKQLMKAAKRSLKSMVGPNSNNIQSQPQDYSNMFEKIYNEAYEASLNAGSNNNNGYTIEDLKHDAIKYFH